jgi:tetratricopeptide (TPR) repeat protein
MNKIFARAAVGAALAIGSAGAFYAGIAYAADPRLDQAIDNCTKAIALLEAATNEGAKREQFHGFRREAIKDIKDAIAAIEKAKAFDDKTPPPAASSAKPAGSSKPSAGK